MVAALAVIWIGFHVMSDGKFITSRNLWNLSVQSTSIAIMATGMVLIIVTRNIDLSVGALLGFLGYTMALVQTDGVISVFGLNLTIDVPEGRPLVHVARGARRRLAARGARSAACRVSSIAYVGVPAFIVTLGGFLAWRGMIFRTGDKQGQTLAPLDDTFRYLGGAPERSLGDAQELGRRRAGVRRHRVQHRHGAPASPPSRPRRSLAGHRRRLRRRRLWRRGRSACG